MLAPHLQNATTNRKIFQLFGTGENSLHNQIEKQILFTVENAQKLAIHLMLFGLY